MQMPVGRAGACGPRVVTARHDVPNNRAAADFDHEAFIIHRKTPLFSRRKQPGVPRLPAKAHFAARNEAKGLDLMCTAGLPAFAGQSGLRAALLARGGFTATMSVIEARYGLAQCFALTPHLAYLTDGLGTHWEILANTYKPFP